MLISAARCRPAELRKSWSRRSGGSSPMKSKRLFGLFGLLGPVLLGSDQTFRPKRRKDLVSRGLRLSQKQSGMRSTGGGSDYLDLHFARLVLELTGFNQRSDNRPKMLLHPRPALLFRRLRDDWRWRRCNGWYRRRLCPLGFGG